MRQFIKRLLGNKSEEDFLDKASDTWEDIPRSEVGMDWGQWLQQDERKTARSRKITVRDKSVPNLLLMSKEAEPGENLSTAMQPQTSMCSNVGKLPATQNQTSAVGPRPRVTTLPLKDRKWRDFLSSYAEHLTDEELREIRKQMT